MALGSQKVLQIFRQQTEKGQTLWQHL